MYSILKRAQKLNKHNDKSDTQTLKLSFCSLYL